MEINYYAVVVCGVLSMVLGFVWYGPLFGKKWMEVVGVRQDDVEARKKMQKGAGPLYALQFLLTLFQIYVLAHFISQLGSIPGLEVSLWIWAAFITPTLAGSAMWNNDSRRISWARFLIQGGYQLIAFVLFALILSSWK